MSISTYDVTGPNLENFKVLPIRFKTELKDKFCEKFGISNAGFVNRLSKKTQFTPTEIEAFNELVQYYYDFYKVQL